MNICSFFIPMAIYLVEWDIMVLSNLLTLFALGHEDLLIINKLSSYVCNIHGLMFVLPSHQSVWKTLCLRYYGSSTQTCSQTSPTYSGQWTWAFGFRWVQQGWLCEGDCDILIVKLVIIITNRNFAVCVRAIAIKFHL